VLAALAGLAALALEAAVPTATWAGGATAALTVLLLALDLGFGAWGLGMTATLVAPDRMTIGSEAEATLTLRFRRSPARVQTALGVDARLGLMGERLADASQGEPLVVRFNLRPNRRGSARLQRVWTRWSGPLGLVWRQREGAADQSVFVTPDQTFTRRQAVRFNARAPIGEKVQLDRGQGGEFLALRDFPQGGDRRAIDWKRSARHGRLLSKEFRTERNHTVALAFDCGRQMVEPWGGAPRIDQALSSGLALAYASLAGGDRVKLFAFDAKVSLDTGVAKGLAAFPALERLTGEVDYSTEATNYTLGLSTLSSQLARRSIVVVFTEFPDATGAELMLSAIGRLASRHVVIFVTFRDQELEDLTAVRPATPADVARAVVAQELLNAREIVIERLRRQGVKVVQATPFTIDFALVDAYLDVKRQELV
jgi:uncharacterized protein (DUF58 family)